MIQLRLPSAHLGATPRTVGVSGLLIALACWTAGMAIIQLLHDAARTPGEQMASTRLSRRVLLAAAGSGLALATGFGLYSSAYMTLFRDTFAWWPILFALPIVILTSAAGLTITRITSQNIPFWVRDYRTSVIPALVSTAEILITGAATEGAIPDFIRLGLRYDTFARFGMLVLGIGIGLAITRTRLSQLVVATAFGLSFAVIYTRRTLNHYSWTFAAAIMWWVLTATLHTIRSASPRLNEHMQRILGM